MPAFTAPTTVKLVRRCTGTAVPTARQQICARCHRQRLPQGAIGPESRAASALYRHSLSGGRAVRYLGGDPPGLTTCDLVCHGVPEADTLNAYLQTELNPAAIARLTFRDGDGWVMKAYDQDGGVLRRMDLKNSLYYNGFMEGYLYRTGCYTCPYATEKRVADLTLGDFWGIGEETPYPNAAAELKKGLSLILVHTDKGQALLNACAPALVTTVRTPEEAVKKNHQLRHPTPDSPAARRFHNLYGKKGAAMPLPTAMRKSGAPCACATSFGSVRHCWP